MSYNKTTQVLGDKHGSNRTKGGAFGACHNYRAPFDNPRHGHDFWPIGLGYERTYLGEDGDGRVLRCLRFSPLRHEGAP